MWSKMLKKRGSGDQGDNQRLPAIEERSRSDDFVTNPPENRGSEGVQPTSRLQQLRREGGVTTDNQRDNPSSSAANNTEIARLEALRQRHWSTLNDREKQEVIQYTSSTENRDDTKRVPQSSRETSRVGYGNIQNEFKRIGGKAQLENAKIICLGNQHNTRKHLFTIPQLINTVARDGDIVLVEEVPANMEIKKEDYQLTKNISADVKVIGWDDAKKHSFVLQETRELYKLQDQINSYQAIGGDMQTHSRLTSEYEQRSAQLMDIAGRQRNESLIRTLNGAIQLYPDKRIFVLAGKDHFKGPILTEDLELLSYIATPKYEESSAIKERARIESSMSHPNLG